MKNLIAIEVFDQDMLGQQAQYEKELLNIVQRLNCQVVTKDFNANTITLYVNASLKKVRKLALQVEQTLISASVSTRKLSLVSAMGSDMAIQGLLSRSVGTLYTKGINIEAIHQNTRQVEMQFMVNEDEYEVAVQAIHANLIEVHDHGLAICEH
jgi:aspartate kinase